ncbi:MAG: 3'-5' exonuclease [Streptosporangiales bacterium]|nr:3'-5' exonuclease [Streptosporangiales bacterium]
MTEPRGRYAAVDVEGNGQQPPDLVEVAVVPIDNGHIGEPRAWLLRPARPVTPIARRIHGLSTEQLADAPTIAEVADEIRTATAGRTIVAHAAHVDVTALKRHLPGWHAARVEDTLRLARQTLPQRPSYSLDALIAELGLDHHIPLDLRRHRAAYDALITARLFIALTNTDMRQVQDGLF